MPKRSNSGPPRPGAVSACAPPFLAIKARHIHDWADGIDVRPLLPVFLRKLVHSTGRDLRRVDFPGYDNAERKGWDGKVEAGAATPWVPDGASRWEFGTNRDARRKADNDYATRTRSTPPAEKTDSAFVFVTPHNWPRKTAWAAAKRAEGQWKDVRALDASDLEQWLEQAIPAQMWMAEQLHWPTDDFETLDRFWQRWAEASDPPLTPAIFEAAILEHRDTLEKWLADESRQPFVVTADSTGEAVAFLACIFQRHDIAGRWSNHAAILHSAHALRKLASDDAPLIPTVRTREAERELSSIYRRRHCIVVRPRNAVRSDPDIALRQLNREAFEKALADIGLVDDRVERLARETGRSPTILRRRLSKIDAIRMPEWAKHGETARDLIPLALIGVWRTDSDADRKIVSTLAGTHYARVEETIARLLAFDDSPVWSIGRYRGIASKMDATFAVSTQIVEKDLHDFFVLAEYVLAEEDPALELPESNRWAAGLYGKIRDHSDALRDGIRETLVVLSVHGNRLFRARTGIDVEARVAALVHDLLTPLTIDKLLSHDRDLPYYAEAAPDTFLSLIEEDLQRSRPTVFGLLKPVESTPFSQCRRTGLLWALECLAWANLGRASAALARLSSIEIHDNYMNKPIASLGAIHCCWLPQTAALLDDRVKSLRTLVKRFPDIGWSVCMAQLYCGPRMAFPNYRPRWRNDASGAGRRPAAAKEMWTVVREALDIALEWPTHNHETIGDLVEKIQWMGENDERAVWDLVDGRANSGSDQNAKAKLRERIRMFAFAPHADRRGVSKKTLERARRACANLRPEDSVIRNARFFTGGSVRFFDEDTADDDIGYGERIERAARLRSEAMKEIWMEHGHNGVVALLAAGGSAELIGFVLAPLVEGAESRADFLRQCLSHEGALLEKMSGCIRGFLRAIDRASLGTLIVSAAGGANEEQLLRLCLCAPCTRDTWRLLHRYPHVRDRYWREVTPEIGRDDDAERNELMDCLIGAERPHAAFHALAHDWSQVETSRLEQLLYAVLEAKPDPVGEYTIEAHWISEALESLNGRDGVDPREIAMLEFAFLVEHSKHPIPNLERQIAESPDFFVYLLVLAYRRANDRRDPPEWRVESTELRATLAENVHRLLGYRLNRIPGELEGGIDADALVLWMGKVRELCAQYGRAKTGDRAIGRLLSHAPFGKNGLWPSDAVCKAMERFRSPDIGSEFVIGVRNARGVYSRKPDKGGAQERKLAAQYRNWARQREFDYPYVSSLLTAVADSYERCAAREDERSKIDKRLIR